MAIAHDASTRFPATENTADTTSGNRSFTHTPIGDPAGVVVSICCQAASVDAVSGVTYAGIHLTRRAFANDTTESGRVEIYTLAAGATIPTGAQTVVLLGATATAKFCTCSTITTTTGYAIDHQNNGQDTTTSANPSISATTTDTTIGYAAIHSGATAPSGTPAAGCSLQNNRDYGALSAQTVRRTSSSGSGTSTIGVTLGSDDWCAAGVWLAETSGPPGVPPPVLMQPLAGSGRP